jgi:transposase-like protein
VSASSRGQTDSPEGDGAHSRDTGRRRYRRWSEEDAERWKGSFEGGRSILEIAAVDQVDPNLVSQWLHRLGVEVYQGRHRVEQLPLKIPSELAELLSNGPNHVLRFLDERVWGLTATESGAEQLRKFCKFVELHKQGTGVQDIADRLQVHRTTVSQWREFTDKPYLVAAAYAALSSPTTSDEKLLPLHLDSGGNKQTGWIQVPIQIRDFSDIQKTVTGLAPLPQTYEIGNIFALDESQINSMKLELFAYLLGMMVGDLGKSGGQQSRFSSMHLDLQLSKKHSSNDRFGKFVCLATNSLGIEMRSVRDKPPTGDTKLSDNPTAAYR